MVSYYMFFKSYLSEIMKYLWMKLHDVQNVLQNNKMGVKELRLDTVMSTWVEIPISLLLYMFEIFYNQVESLKCYCTLSIQTKRQCNSQRSRTCADLGLALHGAHGRGRR